MEGRASLGSFSANNRKRQTMRKCVRNRNVTLNLCDNINDQWSARCNDECMQLIFINSRSYRQTNLSVDKFGLKHTLIGMRVLLFTHTVIALDSPYTDGLWSNIPTNQNKNEFWIPETYMIVLWLPVRRVARIYLRAYHWHNICFASKPISCHLLHPVANTIVAIILAKSKFYCGMLINIAHVDMR